MSGLFCGIQWVHFADVLADVACAKIIIYKAGWELTLNEIETYIDSVDNNLKPIVVKLRALIKGISKDFSEEIKWNVPTYSINKNICSIMAYKKHVNLQIFRGAELADANILAGVGKGMRHLKYVKLDDVNSDVIKKFIKQAVAIDAS